ncbi:MAG: D-aminoacyl-tRNA deacylase [Paracoccaceae bacterium]|nr:D-aminoacyl-tRNA deacylase [Paracoccaceae bacterium]MDE2911414.1 D-aminoacyl-tRNA deacylase [Paracoccaceae bacterium]
MRLLVQRVSSAAVRVEGRVTGSIGGGLLGFFCAMAGDVEDRIPLLARKFVNLRVFRDDAGRMNRSLVDAGGQALIVSQFTLAADTSRGNRPGFSGAASPEVGERMYLAFCESVRQHGVDVETGVFGAEMAVSLENDGPVTIMLDV